MHTAKRISLCAVCLLLSVVPAAAHPLHLSLPAETFTAGDAMTLSVSLDADGLQGAVDVYVAAILPGGGFLCLGGDGAFAAPGTFAPLVSDWVPTPLASRPVLSMILPEGLPAGEYTWAAALVPAGGTIADASSWLALDIVRWTYEEAAFTLAASSIGRSLAPEATGDELVELVAGNTSFAVDLYTRLGEETGGNVFFSPYSISQALAMAWAGARGDTERQIADTLGFTLPQDRFHAAVNALDQGIALRAVQSADEKGEGFRLKAANAAWGQTGHPFLPGYLDVLAVNYGAGLRLLDFSAAPEPSRIVINDWVEEKTEGRIKDLLAPGAVTDLTRLVLTNAVYFKAAWAEPFAYDATRNDEFRLLGGTTVTVPTMHRTGDFAYAAGEGYTSVEMDYYGRTFAVLLLLPDPGRFAEVEGRLTPAFLEDAAASLAVGRVALSLPRFSFETEAGLGDILETMGMADAFLPGIADFSGMDGTRDLFVSDVVHKAFVAVDEAGTEAAAATAVIVGTTGLPPTPVPVSFDRPFIFFIRDKESGTILFAGRVLNPAE